LLTQTSKSLDILLNPVHSQPLISESNVEEPLFGKVVRAREAPKTETIVDRNADNRLSNSNGLLHDERQIVALVSSTSVGKCPPMDPEGDWKLLVFVSRRTDNVQVQTVFRRLVEGLVELNGQHIVSVDKRWQLLTPYPTQCFAYDLASRTSGQVVFSD
jgi:hypothetical protein